MSTGEVMLWEASSLKVMRINEKKIESEKGMERN